MEIEKILTIAAPSAQVWQLLLDPTIMASCVPGMQSIDVISDTEYHAVMAVKISFLSAKFKLKTRIVEQRAPSYLRAEGTGEDASVASSLKQQTELFLADMPNGQTELRMKVKVDVLGRLGSFGLSVMKTKADRMWEEFGRNLVAKLEAGSTPPNHAEKLEQKTTLTPIRQAQEASEKGASETATTSASAAAPAPTPAPRPATIPPQAATTVGVTQNWWQRLLGGTSAGGVQATPSGEHVRIEIRRSGETITVHWPVAQAEQCARWLDGYLQTKTGAAV